MRRKIWLQFHMGTIALLAILLVANVATALRPFSSKSPENRTPANVITQAEEPTAKRSLKIVQLPCEPNLRIRIFENVQSLRLQFDACPTSAAQPLRDVVSVINTTNGFEGTVFGGTIAAPGTMAEHIEHAGVFTSAEAPPSKTKPKRAPATSVPSRAFTPAFSPAFSTDFITLADGVNEIKIERTAQTQTLRIERK